MSLARWFLLIGWVPIVFGADAVSSFRHVRVREFCDASNGSLFAIVSFRPNDGSQVWAWSAELTNRRTIYTSRDSFRNDAVTDLVCKSDGSQVMFCVNQQLRACDVATGNEIWRSKTRGHYGQGIRSHLAADEKYVLLIGTGRQWSRRPVTIINADDGREIGQVQPQFMNRFVWSNNRFAYQIDPFLTDNSPDYKGGAWKVYEISDNQIQFLETVRPTPRALMDSDGLWELDLTASYEYQTTHRFQQSPSQYEMLEADGYRPTRFVSAGRNLSKPVSHVRLAPLGRNESMLLLVVVGLAYVFWVSVLIADGQRSAWPRRIWLDSLLAGGLLLLICTSIERLISGDHILRSPQGVNFVQQNAMLIEHVWFSYFGALAVSLAVITLIRRPKPQYVWFSLFIACALPVLIPPLVLVLGLVLAGVKFGLRQEIECSRSSQSRGLASQSGRSTDTVTDQEVEANAPSGELSLESGQLRQRMRFGIREMMLATAVAAVFIGVGQLSMYLLPYGIALALLIALSLLMTASRPSTWILLAVSLWAAAMFGASDSLLGSTDLVFLATIPAVIAFAAVYGYRIYHNQRAGSAESVDQTLAPIEPVTHW
ncbi:MAG: hypothetical protein HKN47_14480 [Pirellulaceae bacterium]|nr:hypothetical protein [Pirellulaceae bacterium]